MTYQIPPDENFKILTDRNITVQTLSTAYAFATASEISYMPSSNASFVIYQYTVHMFRGSIYTDKFHATFKLQYSDDGGSSWSDWGDNTVIFIHEVGGDLDIRSAVDIKFAISTSGWNNVKALRLIAKQDQTSTDTALHAPGTTSQKFYGDSSYESQRYFPSVSCYSVN